jgi:hypothetical protein
MGYVLHFAKMQNCPTGEVGVASGKGFVRSILGGPPPAPLFHAGGGGAKTRRAKPLAGREGGALRNVCRFTPFQPWRSAVTPQGVEGGAERPLLK